ncbi:GntR family transcriptional regulator [Arthrobacter mobilis]|uniref:GntR family transcriptional regulator n=1 Tax=Arthrobacter mobilis TaxID=2724944 RepID=A0A7X6HCI4_9MICC|nr:GntR family transcriptional regulator [Arthrobacter mobilis]NKX54611.1 GntR family transcriptional regulator [Arthrobacter mobilis]
MSTLTPAGPAAAVSKSEQAYETLKERITSGSLVPGYRLVLSTIADELGFSVVPVREALRRLEAEGLVTFERNVGATVAGVDAMLYLHTMQTLSVIEGAATALAAPLITAEDITRARYLNRELRACLENFEPARFSRINNDFHAILYGHCPNPHILDLVHRGWNRLSAMRASTFDLVPGRARQSVEEHEKLLALIESGADLHEIEMAARAHRTATLNAYMAQQNQPPSAI